MFPGIISGFSSIRLKFLFSFFAIFVFLAEAIIFANSVLSGTDILFSSGTKRIDTSLSL